MKKYRPVLSAAQIAHLISLCKDRLDLPESISCIGTLSPFMAKIENTAIQAAYTLQPNKSLVDELGLGEENIATKTHELYQKHLYEQWLAVGMKNDSFSLVEIKEISLYRYLNDLMLDEESEAFEAENNLSF